MASYYFSDREERISWFGRKKRSCNLKKYDKYTFIIGLKVPPDGNVAQAVKLTMGHRYYHSVFQLKEGIRATLQSGMGTGAVSATLRSFAIEGERVRPEEGLDKLGVKQKLLSAARYSAQFFLSPVLDPRNLTEEEEED